MSNNVLVGGLQMFAKMLADRLHVQLIFGAKKTYTDNVSIHLPALPLDSQKASVLALGYIVRGASRIRSSDVSSQPQYNQGLLYDLWYLLEEVWIENQAHRKYPGARRTLNALCSLLIEKDMIPHLDHDSSPAAIFLAYVHFRLRTTVLEQSMLQEHADESRQMVNFILSPSVFDKIDSMMDRIRTCSSTKDNVNLAREMIELLHIDHQNSLPDEQQEEQSTESDSSPDESQSCESEQATSSDEKSDEGSSEEGSDDGDNSDPESTLDGNDTNDSSVSADSSSDTESAGQGTSTSESEGSEGDEPGNPSGSDPDNTESDSQENAQSTSVGGNGASDQLGNAEKMRSILEDQTRPGANDLGSLTAKALNDFGQRSDDGSSVKVVMSEAKVATEWLSGADMLQETRASTNALRSKLHEMLEAQSRCKRDFAKKGKRIVPARVWMLKAGNTRVFERESEGSKIDTAVLVLLDRSESMGAQVNSGSMPNQTVLSLACQSTLALMLALSNTDGIHAAAAAFPAPHGNERGVTLLTDFHERAASTASRYASLGIYGGTPMAEALLWAIYKIMSQKAERRIIFIKTDGVPSRKPETEKVLKMAMEAGIEIIGLGIKVDINHLIPTSSRIDSIDEMPKSVFQLLQSTLTLPMAA